MGGQINFYDTSNAGTAILVSNPRVFDGFPGETHFYGSSSAENSTIITEPGTTGLDGLLYFHETSTAGNATITNHSAFLAFQDASTAGNSTIINNRSTGLVSGACTFFDTATAGNATIIVNGGSKGGEGGSLGFVGDSSGGTARVKVFGNGGLGIGGHNAPGVTIGSIEGDGVVSLDVFPDVGRNLTVGTNNLNTTFSGLIDDGGFGGSLTKTGTGRLTLTGANAYIGGTIVNGGILLANNTSGSATGKGLVEVISGTLGGDGTIAGAVAVGIGNGSGAFLGPGENSVTPGTLTIRKNLKLLADATYRVTMNSSTPAVDKVNAKGFRIRGGLILFNDGAGSVLPRGTVFSVIDNSATTPISGTFSNLADGATVTVGSNTFQADYQGGDGNDLTLTVVP
jgi:autotransporter-associated beta strand protein